MSLRLNARSSNAHQFAARAFVPPPSGSNRPWCLLEAERPRRQSAERHRLGWLRCC